MNEILKPVCPHNPDIECPCPKDCPRHGKCCACVAHHRAMGNLPRCSRWSRAGGGLRELA